MGRGSFMYPGSFCRRQQYGLAASPCVVFLYPGSFRWLHRYDGHASMCSFMRHDTAIEAFRKRPLNRKRWHHPYPARPPPAFFDSRGQWRDLWPIAALMAIWPSACHVGLCLLGRCSALCAFRSHLRKEPERGMWGCTEIVILFFLVFSPQESHRYKNTITGRMRFLINARARPMANIRFAHGFQS
jgi:hypothetical protein